MRIFLQILLVIVSSFLTSSSTQTVQYVLEGKDVTLKCGVSRPISRGARLYWLGPVGGVMDNYAIDDSTFNKDYKVDLDRSQGRYDLTIFRATYRRNNGLFMCKMREEGGNGDDLHSTSLNLTVLIKPGSPRVIPQRPSVTQGQPIRMTCSSQGGSPDPEIFWYRRSDGEHLQSVLKPGGGRDYPTTSVLTLQPTKEDDGEEFMCEVRNRALSPQEKMVSSVRLNVDYYPIVRITPSNPVRVIRGQDVTLSCEVDAKPTVQNVRWMRGGAFIRTTPQLSLRNVNLDDSGRYICQADNNLGRPGEAEVTLDVLYPPSVNVPPVREVALGGDVIMACNVSSNPPPDFVYWTKMGDDTFRQKTELLRLTKVRPADHGDYVCHAVSVLSPSGGDEITLEGNATMGIRVRHTPGESFILPAHPVAVEGKGTVLTCGANPPGYPDTKYRWWRDGVAMNIGENFTIPITSREHGGEYHCQPFNLLGNGTVVSANLRVFQAPRITEGLKPTAVYRRERTDLKLSCRARGNPKPEAKWFKDGQELKESAGFYVVRVNQTKLGSKSGGFVVQSTLLFQGPERIGVTQGVLRPEDRGNYECSFENEAERVTSAQLLRVQHPPTLAHRRTRVAFDVGETAVLSCRMRAYPPPTFEWAHNNNLLQGAPGSDPQYAVTSTHIGDDVYESLLRVKGVSEADYGPYTCKGMNEEGPSKTLLFLQRKGLPGPPEMGAITDVGVDFLEVSFEVGFDGGFPKATNYSIRIERAIGGRGQETVVHCGPHTKCLISGLHQDTPYRLFLYSENPKGHSTLSDPIEGRTPLDPSAIPAPIRVFAETGTGTVIMSAPDRTETGHGHHPMNLDGQLEVKYGKDLQWSRVPGVIEVGPSTGGRFEIGPIANGTQVRARLCARKSLDLCGPFQEAKYVSELPQYVSTKSASSNPLTAIVAAVAVILAAVIFVAVICCCYRRRRRRSGLKKKKKGADMEVAHRGVVTQQAPPPPYYTVGLENKGMEGGSLGQLNDHSKSSFIYGAKNQQQQQQQYQNYAPNSSNSHGSGGYLENSYSNSNNGGSVNSQDSLWQVKGQDLSHQGQDHHLGIQGQGHHTSPQGQGHHTNPQGHHLSHQGQGHHYPGMGDHSQMAPPHSPQSRHGGDHLGYQYNPQYSSHSGTPGINAYDDYALCTTGSAGHAPVDDYSRGYPPPGVNPYDVRTHRDMDGIDDSYEVSGIPNPYLESQVNPNLHGVPHMTSHDGRGPHNFDESLESGFSTPNSRNRRIIREIIV